MPEYLDQNDREVAALLEAYDLFVQRAEAYLQSLDRQHEAANGAGQIKYAHHIDVSRLQSRRLLDLLESGVLDEVIGLRNHQHNIRLAKEGKLM